MDDKEGGVLWDEFLGENLASRIRPDSLSDCIELMKLGGWLDEMDQFYPTPNDLEELKQALAFATTITLHAVSANREDFARVVPMNTKIAAYLSALRGEIEKIQAGIPSLTLDACPEGEAGKLALSVAPAIVELRLHTAAMAELLIQEKGRRKKYVVFEDLSEILMNNGYVPAQVGTIRSWLRSFQSSNRREEIIQENVSYARVVLANRVLGHEQFGREHMGETAPPPNFDIYGHYLHSAKLVLAPLATTAARQLEETKTRPKRSNIKK